MPETHERRRGTGRQRALRAARALFTTQGYAATSIQDVLNASGLSRGALYHHFTNKAELFTAVLEDVEQALLTRILASAAEAPSALAAVRAGATEFLNQALEPTVRRIVITDAPTVLGWSKWREIDNRYAFGALKAGLTGAIESGELSIDPDLADSYAHVLLAALMEMGLLIAGAADPPAAHDRATRSIDTLLGRLEQPGT